MLHAILALPRAVRIELVRAISHSEGDGCLAPTAAALAVVVVRIAPLSARSLLALVEEGNPDAIYSGIWLMSALMHLARHHCRHRIWNRVASLLASLMALLLSLHSFSFAVNCLQLA